MLPWKLYRFVWKFTRPSCTYVHDTALYGRARDRTNRSWETEPIAPYLGDAWVRDWPSARGAETPDGPGPPRERAEVMI
jgi:hypothetical protein